MDSRATLLTYENTTDVLHAHATVSPVASECVCDWLREAIGLDCGDRSWICNAPLIIHCNVPSQLGRPS